MDAVNNLSDALSSVITTVGAKLSQRPAQAAHNYFKQEGLLQSHQGQRNSGTRQMDETILEDWHPIIEDIHNRYQERLPSCKEHHQAQYHQWYDGRIRKLT